MSKKKAFVLRLDPDVYAALEKWAADEFRSVNGQLEWIFDKVLKERGRIPGKPIEKPRTHVPEKENLPGGTPTDSEH